MLAACIEKEKCSQHVLQMEMIYLILVNLFAFAAYGADKNRAKHHAWRIPENTLILLALMGGSAGALAGMYVFHHKTRKTKFKIGIPLILICQMILIWSMTGK